MVAPRYATEVGQEVWVSAIPLCLLCPTNPGLALIILPIKPHTLEKNHKGEVLRGFWEVMAQKGTQVQQLAAKVVPQCGVEVSAPQLRHCADFPQAFVLRGVLLADKGRMRRL